MNYWPAEVANLSECHEPLFRMVRELRSPAGEVAQTVYKRRGWVAHHNTTIWRDAQPVDNNAMPVVLADGRRVVLRRTFGSTMLFTGDRAVSRRPSLPGDEGAAEFCSDWLVDDGRGHLVTAAGNSPENDFHYKDADGKQKTAGISHGADDGSGDHPRAVRQLHRAPPRS